MTKREQLLTEFLSVRFSPDERNALQLIADERTCSMGAVLRWAVHVALLGEPSDAAMQTAQNIDRTGVHDA